MTRPKKFIVTAVAIGACTGGLVHLVKLHAQPVAASPQKLTFHTGANAFPGSGTPESTLQTLGWAAGNGDLELLQDYVTPDIKRMLHEHAGPHMETHAIGVATQLGKARILNKEVLSDGQVLLSVLPEGKDNPWNVRMQKIDGNWKLAGLEL